LLHRLEKERAVKAYEEKKEGRTRRYYRLTGRGRGRLAGEAETRQRCGEAVTAALCSTL
jgi:DNA-binding PadR family transcriptional regulator